MRTTLYSRLKPNYKILLEDKSKIYPTTVKLIKESLQETLYSKLTICEVTDLTFLLEIERTDKQWWTGSDLFNLEEYVA